jgi:hypothetical protein
VLFHAALFLPQLGQIGNVLSGARKAAERPAPDEAATTPIKRSCEKINNLIPRPRDQGAKTRKEELLCFLCAFYDFAPLREMFLIIQGLFQSFRTSGQVFTLPHALCFQHKQGIVPMESGPNSGPIRSDHRTTETEDRFLRRHVFSRSLHSPGFPVLRQPPAAKGPAFLLLLIRTSELTPSTEVCYI